MSNVLVRSDIDGNLFRCVGDSPEHYAKALSTGVAWHIYEPQDLKEAAGAVVQSVVTDLGEGLHWIHYRPQVELLQLLGLRELAHLDGPLALWRGAKLALELSKQLKALHDADVFQLLIHPGRVAQIKNELVLLPTFAGPLSLLSEALANPSEGWLHYVAPEVLRTRGMQKNLLVAGDVYALGRLLEAMCVSTPATESVSEPFELARRRVELLDRDPFGEMSPALGPLADLIRSMCAPLPSGRPSLDAVMRTLEDLVLQHAPDVEFAAFQQRKSLEQARACYSDFSEAYAERVFGVTSRSLHLMAADLAMMQSPPDCNTAVYELDQAESLNQYEADVQFRLGRAYALWTTMPQHMTLSSEAYKRAAYLSGWKASILEEWAQVLRNDSPTSVLQHTDDVPPEATPLLLVELRTLCLTHLGDHEAAWDEIAPSFARFGFDQGLFELAQRVAQNVDPATLIRWMHFHKDHPGLGAPLAIAWHFNGNPEMAESCLEQAKSYQQ